MTLKTLLTITILTVLPTLSLAGPEGCSHGGKEQAMSCMEGFVLDLVTGFCVPVTTS